MYDLKAVETVSGEVLKELRRNGFCPVNKGVTPSVSGDCR